MRAAWSRLTHLTSPHARCVLPVAQPRTTQVAASSLLAVAHTLHCALSGGPLTTRHATHTQLLTCLCVAGILEFKAMGNPELLFAKYNVAEG